MKLGRGGVDRLRWSASRPTNQSRHAYTPFQYISFDAVERSEGIEGAGFVGKTFDVAFAMRAIVAGKHHQRIVIDAEILQGLNHVGYRRVNSTNHGGEALLLLSPVLLGIVRVNPGIDCIPDGIDHFSGFTDPLHAALYASTFRV